MSLLRRAHEVYQTEGPLTLAWRSVRFLGRQLAPWNVYNHRVRPRLPRTDETATFNEVEVRPFRTLDSVVPWHPPPAEGGHQTPEEYEQGLVASVRSQVEPGDDVVVVGGGLGVSTVAAAEAARDDGSVQVFEGARQAAAITRETANRNDVADRVTVDHTIVADAVSLNGDPGDADLVAPTDLPTADVLVMDCEGAEMAILDGLTDRPRTVVVETHRNREAVRRQLTDELGYEIANAELAEPEPYRDLCERAEIYVLTAINT